MTATRSRHAFGRMANQNVPRTEGRPGGRDGRQARLALLLLVAVLVAGGGLRAWLVARDHSIYWPDEVYKSLEPAHRAVFGYGFRAWEYVLGAANWTFAGLLAAVLAVVTGLGLDDPAGYVVVIRATLAASTLAAAWATAWLARRSGASPLAAVAAAALVALPAPVVYFSHRALSETASLLPVAAGLALALPAGAGRRAVVGGASLMGLAVLLRLHNALFCAGLVATVAWRRDWAGLRAVLVTLAVWAAAYGVIDWVTWGSPFHSAVEYLRFSVIEDGASRFGTSPFAYYFQFLFRAAGPALAVVVAVLVLVGARRAPALFAMAAAFVLFHSAIGHKEARFVLASLSLLAALAAVGADTVAGWTARPPAALVAVVGVVVAASALSGARLGGVDYGDVGQGHLFAAGASAYEHGDAINRLLLAAHDRPDLCGLEVEHEVVVFTGGYTYLHRRVPLWDRNGPPRQSGRFNYAIGLFDPADPGVVARDGGLALTRLSSAGCAPGPAFDDRLSPNGP